MTADNLLGVIMAKLGEAGYKVTNSAYYDRMYSAYQRGDQQGAEAIREYLTLGKGVDESQIDSNMRTMTRKGNLFPALEANKAAEIAKAIKELQGYGSEVKDIKSAITKEMKPKYLAADAAGKVKIRDAIQKAYRAMGLTAADADKVINGWKKEKGEEKSSANVSTVISELYKQTEGKAYGLGNIDLNHRKVAHNPDGSISTELSFTVGYDDKIYLLPSVIDGKVVSDEEAIKHFEKTGEHLGIFTNDKEADEYAEKLHLRQEWYYTGK